MEGHRHNLAIATILQRFVGRVSSVSHQLTTSKGDRMLTSVLKGDLGDMHSVHYHLISFVGEYMCTSALVFRFTPNTLLLLF